MSSIGDILRLYRAKFNISQIELAKRLDISVNFLSQVENNKKNVSFSKIDEISKNLGFSKELMILVSSNPPIELGEKQKRYFTLMQEHLINYILKK